MQVEYSVVMTYVWSSNVLLADVLINIPQNSFISVPRDIEIIYNIFFLLSWSNFLITIGNLLFPNMTATTSLSHQRLRNTA